MATPAVAAAAAAAVVSAADGSGSNSEGPASGGGVRGGCNGRERRLRRSPEDLAREARENLDMANSAILQLEPWFAAAESRVGGGIEEEEGDRQAGT